MFLERFEPLPRIFIARGAITFVAIRESLFGWSGCE
jgi:hypothetical protein